MTCIVGITWKKKVYIGGDSCGSGGGSYGLFGQTKVFKVETEEVELLIGGCGSYRMIDLLTYELKEHIIRSHPEDTDDKFIRTGFVEAVRACLKEGGLAHIEDNVEEGGNFLIGYHGRLYEMQPDYSVLNCPEWGYAVGSGEDVARGSLWTTQKQKNDPEGRIITSLEAAEAVICSVRGPMYVKEL